MRASQKDRPGTDESTCTRTNVISNEREKAESAVHVRELKLVAGHFSRPVSGENMDGARDAAAAFLAARQSDALAAAGWLQSELVEHGLLSPTTDARPALVVALFATYLLLKLVVLRTVTALLFAERVPAVHVPLTPLEADLNPPGGTWVRHLHAWHTPSTTHDTETCHFAYDFADQRHLSLKSHADDPPQTLPLATGPDQGASERLRPVLRPRQLGTPGHGARGGG